MLALSAGGPNERGPLKVEYNEETSVRKSLAFEIEPEVVEKEIETRAKHYAKRVKIPGFRPGKIPVDVIKKRFRGQVLEDVVEKIVNKVVHDELEGRGLRPLTTPKVTELKVDGSKATATLTGTTTDVRNGQLAGSRAVDEEITFAKKGKSWRLKQIAQ